MTNYLKEAEAKEKKKYHVVIKTQNLNVDTIKNGSKGYLELKEI